MDQRKPTGYPSIDRPWLKYYTEEQINAPLPHMTAYEYIKAQNADRLDYVAIDSDFGNYSYRELFAHIDATASALWSCGVRKGKNILAMFPVLPHESFLFYGVDAVGAALGQIAPMYTPIEVCHYANRIDADLFFVSDFNFTPELEKLMYQNTKVRHIIVVAFCPLQNMDNRTMTWDAFISRGENVTLPEIQRNPSEDVLLLGFTSGTTGIPKCVMLSDDCLNIASHQYLNCAIDFLPGDSMLRIIPAIIVSAAVACHHLPFCAGLRLIYTNHPTDANAFAELVLRKKPNHSIITAAIVDTFENSKNMAGQDLSFIKVMGCGGMSITRTFEERTKIFFKNHNISGFFGYGWGNSECAACVANRISPETTRIGTSGIPMVHTVVAAFDMDTGAELPYNKIGELCIQSPNMMMGYYGDPELTSRAIRSHADGSVWLHTGDLGSIDENGLVTVKGRVVRMLLLASMIKLFPQALEDEISTVSGVQNVVFCGVPDPNNDGFSLPVCYIVPAAGYSDEAVLKAVRTYCENVLPTYSHPVRIFIKSELPLTKGNKPDIQLLEQDAVTAMHV